MRELESTSTPVWFRESTNQHLSAMPPLLSQSHPAIKSPASFPNTPCPLSKHSSEACVPQPFVTEAGFGLVVRVKGGFWCPLGLSASFRWGFHSLETGGATARETSRRHEYTDHDGIVYTQLISRHHEMTLYLYYHVSGKTITQHSKAEAPLRHK